MLIQAGKTFEIVAWCNDYAEDLGGQNKTKQKNFPAHVGAYQSVSRIPTKKDSQ